jgi:AraC-like DNA-binding protein
MAADDKAWSEGLEPRAEQRQLRLGHRHGWIRAEIKKHRGESKPVVAGSNRPLAVNIVLRGEGTFTDELNNTWPLRPGSCFFPMPGLACRAVYSGDALEFFVVFDRFTSRSLRDIGFVRTVPFARTDTDDRLRQNILDILDWLAADSSVLSDRELLLRLLGFIENLQKQGSELRQADSSEARIASACLLLEDPVNRSMPVKEVAFRVGMSYRAFRDAFTRLKGCTPVVYRIERRLDRAARMLAEKTVKEVAADLGYSDPATFSQQFTRHHGVPPSRYHK